MAQRSHHRHDQRDERFDLREERHNDRYAHYSARGPEFRRRQYVINDYRLSPPPRGHQ